MSSSAMTCPKCGLPQPEAEECARCGVVVRKVRREPPPLPVPVAAEAAPSSGAGAGWVLLVLLLFGVAAGLVLFDRSRRAHAGSSPEGGDAPRASTARRVPRRGGAESPMPVETPSYLRGTERAPGRDSSAAAPAAPAAARHVSAWYEGAEGYRRADEERKRYGKPMAVYFHTDWCGWCKKLDRDYLGDAEVNAYFDGLAKVKLNPERSREEAELARQYGVHGFPSFFIVPAARDGANRVYPFQAGGQMTPAEFVAACRDAES